ncbi:family 43 glycosylhydrolase [Cellulomonas sp.]|uniref:family 43 glycosylhydrolase n=1 Tax=Cellulomonas sp. TaxID=40001 RepID=UPI00281193D8|nr:family 43 glycosylhydrolase [Cellulomonas sp.]
MEQTARRPVRRAVTAAAALALLAAAAAGPPATAAPDARGGHGPGDGRATYVNPVGAGAADTFADPAVVRGQDGWWYAYGTTDPLREGEGTRHLLPVSRSRDLVTWEHVGDAFTERTLPSWADTDPARRAALWAPDIRYVDGEYRLYYVVTQTTLTPGANDSAIGVATAPTPTGPWTDAGAPVVGPRPGSGGPDDFLWTYDPHHVVGPDGRQHLFYGSYYGGIWVTELDATGTEAVGEPVQVTVDNKYEGAYVLQREGHWYLFASSANCCAGPTTGYSVHVGRADAPTGPYLDRDGVPLLASRAGGTPVLVQNGNRWVGAGHNAVVTDLAGQDWVVYHAIDRADPYLDGTEGVNERPMLIDRLDWVDGWPVVRGGAGPSDDRQAGPVGTARTVTGFERGTRPWRGEAWRTAPDDPQGGPHAVARRPGTLVTHRALPGPVRVEADVRLEGRAVGGVVAGVAAGGRKDGRHDALHAELDQGRGHGRAPAVTAVVDPGAGVLRLRSGDREATAPLPPGPDWSTWHALALEVDGRRARAELSHARLGDPLAEAALDLPHTVRAGAAGAVALTPGVRVDDLSAVRLAAPPRAPQPVPEPGALVEDVTFEDGTGPGWTAVRAPQVTVEDGDLVWPVEQADLVGPGGTAGLLLRDVPDGDWTAETVVRVDLGVDTVRNYQQAGLVVHADDDLFARLSHVAIWNTRQTEFGHETPYAGRTSYGGTIVGPPGDRTWLRLVHRTDDAGEHEVRALTSTDGTRWAVGGVWTFPPGTALRVGLAAHGWNGTDPRAVARFEHLRLWRD